MDTVTKQYYTVAELAGLLKTPLQYLHFLLRNYDIPHKKGTSDGIIRFHKKDVARWVERNKNRVTLIDILTDRKIT